MMPLWRGLPGDGEDGGLPVGGRLPAAATSATAISATIGAKGAMARTTWKALLPARFRRVMTLRVRLGAVVLLDAGADADDAGAASPPPGPDVNRPLSS